MSEADYMGEFDEPWESGCKNCGAETEPDSEYCSSQCYDQHNLGAYEEAYTFGDEDK